MFVTLLVSKLITSILAALLLKNIYCIDTIGLPFIEVHILVLTGAVEFLLVNTTPHPSGSIFVHVFVSPFIPDDSCLNL